MDGLTLAERHIPHYRSRIDEPYQSARREPYLPTPQPRGTRNVSGNERRISHLLNPVHPGETYSLPSRSAPLSSDAGRTSTKTGLRHDYPKAQSPPYQHFDHVKPSLPPLKTVLGETVVSPPATPNMRSVSLQPSPREPMYSDSSTYKPPSLYPSKKPRTDSGHPHDRSGSDQSSRTLPSLVYRPEDTSYRSTNELSTPLSDRGGDRRSPRPFGDRASTATTPNAPAVQYPMARVDNSQDGRVRSPDPKDYFRFQGQAPASTFAQSCDDAVHHHRPYEEYSPVMVSPAVQSRRASVDQQGHPQHQYLSMAPPEYRAEPQHRPQLSDGVEYGEKRPCYRRDAAPFHGDGFTTSSYYGHPTFFVPTHYEYQNGKPRKRSNLPKQSTEIMKRWFDENMHNPYPSEEQKRHFANVAGINLTQVSNWFINHRRRCPELREKREKGRSPEGDDDL